MVMWMIDLNKFHEKQRDILVRYPLPGVVKAVVLCDLLSYPGSGVLELLAYHFTGQRRLTKVTPIVLPEIIRLDMAEEADRAGEGLYHKEDLLRLSDSDLAWAYIDAMKSFVDSQLG